MPTRQQARHEPSVEEGQDSGGNEDIPLATAIPAPVQDALNSIDQRFGRLESLLAGLTTRQTANVTLHDQQAPGTGNSALAASSAPPGNVSAAGPAQLDLADVAAQLQDLRGELATLQGASDDFFDPTSIKPLENGDFPLVGASRTTQGEVPYQIATSWAERKTRDNLPAALELLYHLNAKLEALLAFVVAATQLRPEGDETDFDNIRSTVLHTLVSDELRGLGAINEVSAVLFDLLSNLEQKTFGHALAHTELQGRNPLASARLFSRTATGRKAEVEANAKIIERAIDQKIRALASGGKADTGNKPDDRERSRKDSAKRKTADAARRAAGSAAAKGGSGSTHQNGQSDAPNSRPPRAASRGRGDGKDDSGAAK